MAENNHDDHPRSAHTLRGGSRGSRGGGSSRNLTPPTPNPIDIWGEPKALALLSGTLTDAGSSCDLKRFRDFSLPEPS